MGLFKQLMIFGKTALQGLPTRVTLFSLGLSADKGLLGSPFFYSPIMIHNMGSCGRLGESPNTWKHFGSEPKPYFCAFLSRKEPTQARNSVISVLLRQETVTWGGWTWAAMDSGTRITGGGSGHAAHLAHAEGVLYGTELGSVT